MRTAGVTLFALALVIALPSRCDMVVVSVPCGSIPDQAPQTGSGIFMSGVQPAVSGTVAAGNAVTIILKGLQHGWSGDLAVTLSYIDPQGNTLRSATLFSRLGQTAARPSGSWATFGYPNTTGDNYAFNSDFPADLHATAASLGFADSIPGEQSGVSSGFRFFTSDSPGVRNDFSYAFAGLDLASGVWRLTISDLLDHKGQAGTITDFGSLVG